MSKPIVLGLLLVIPLVADAKPKPKGNAKVHIDRAAKAHKDGKYQVALSELETAYSIDPQPKLLYAIGQVHAKLGNCTAAVSHYEKFIASTKDKAKQEVVKQAITACKSKEPEKEDKDAVFRHKKPPAEDLPTAEPKKIESTEKAEPKEIEPKPEPKAEPAPEPKEELPPPTAPEPSPRAERDTLRIDGHKPWYRDWLGNGLVIGGVGVSVASVFLYKGALDDLDAAEKSSMLSDYNKYVDSAHDKRTYTIIVAGAGVTLIAAGILRYATRSTGEEAHSVSVAPTQGGGLITWSGGF